MGVGRSGGVGKGKGRCLSCSMTGPGGSYWLSGGGGRGCPTPCRTDSAQILQPFQGSQPPGWPPRPPLPVSTPLCHALPLCTWVGLCDWQHVTRVMRSLPRWWWWFCFFFAVLGHVGSSSLTRDQTWIPCIGSLDS